MTLKCTRSVDALVLITNLLLILNPNTLATATIQLKPTTKYHTILFDAYGTLLDFSTLSETLTNITTKPEEFLLLWRTKQLNYAWLRSLMGKSKYKDFWKITRDALEFSLEKYKINLPDSEKNRLMNGWLLIPPYADVSKTVQSLKNDYQLAVLSQGSPKMLKEVFQFNKLDKIISPLISVHDVKVYKPHPKTFALAKFRLKLPKSRILFVSSNGWDVCGAKSFGFPTAWINRAGEPMEKFEVIPDFEFKDFTELSQYLQM